MERSLVVQRRATWFLRTAASLATRLSFGKLFGVATLVGFGEKRCRKNLPLHDIDRSGGYAKTIRFDSDIAGDSRRELLRAWHRIRVESPLILQAGATHNNIFTNSRMGVDRNRTCSD